MHTDWNEGDTWFSTKHEHAKKCFTRIIADVCGYETFTFAVVGN